MKLIPILILAISCAHRENKPDQDQVSVNAALNQAQASYLKGCVDALKTLRVPKALSGCRDRSILHRQEIDGMMEQIP
jgi:hypothetical protein